MFLLLFITCVGYTNTEIGSKKWYRKIERGRNIDMESQVYSIAANQCNKHQPNIKEKKRRKTVHT